MFSKEYNIASEEKAVVKSEERNQNQFDKDIGLFANTYYNNHSYT